jgi:hypothetical protein
MQDISWTRPLMSRRSRSMRDTRRGPAPDQPVRSCYAGAMIFAILRSQNFCVRDVPEYPYCPNRAANKVPA